MIGNTLYFPPFDADIAVIFLAARDTAMGRLSHRIRGNCFVSCVAGYMCHFPPYALPGSVPYLGDSNGEAGVTRAKRPLISETAYSECGVGGGERERETPTMSHARSARRLSEVHRTFIPHSILVTLVTD